MKPLIGITVDAKFDAEDSRTNGKLTLNWNYAQVIADAGGIPILIPPQADPAEMACLIDGWLIPGGNDIDSKHWGEELHPAAEVIEPQRFDLERALYSQVPPDMPVLGICYGCQFINVAQGGSLTQHLPDVTGHALDQKGNMQTYDLATDSQAAQVLGTAKATGESWHHQAVARVGTGLSVVGRNEDGTIEALESCEKPWMIGVQWHPERTPDAADSQSLFKNFVEAAAKYRTQRQS